MINFPIILLAWPCFMVWLIDWWCKSQNSYLIGSGAYPNSTHAIQSTHYFQICIVTSISQLLIEIPDRIGISNQISVMDQHYKIIDFVAYPSATHLLIEFAQPILSGQKLSVAIHGVKSSVRSSQTWVYSLYARNLDGGAWQDREQQDREQQNTFTLVGIARIPTYCDLPHAGNSACG